MRSGPEWLWPVLCCAIVCAPGARAEDKKPGGLDLDDLGAVPAKKKAPAPKDSKAPWLKGNKPGARPDAAASKKPAPAPKAPVAAPPPPSEGPGVFVGAPPGSGTPAVPPAAPTPAKPAPSAAPPLLKLATQYGIFMPRSELVDEATAADVESGLKTIAFQAPMSTRPSVLHPKTVSCAPEDDACFVARGAEAGVDEVIVASLARAGGALGLTIRRVDVLAKKRVAEATQGGLSTDRIELKAWGEALLCRLIVPMGCGGELLVETGGAELQIAGDPLPKSGQTPERIKLPVGVHAIRAMHNGKAGPERMVPVLRETSAQLAFTVRDSPDGPHLVAPHDKGALPAPTDAVAGASEGSGRRWTRPVGYAVAAAGGAALLVGVVQGLRSKSMIQSAESGYQANGGAYRPANLSDLSSGNSAAQSANLLFAVGGVLAAAGLVVAFAF